MSSFNFGVKNGFNVITGKLPNNSSNSRGKGVLVNGQTGERTTIGAGCTEGQPVKTSGKEAQVAFLLGMSPAQFAALSEDEKQRLVAQYNMQHPDNPIPDKQR